LEINKYPFAGREDIVGNVGSQGGVGQDLRVRDNEFDGYVFSFVWEPRLVGL